MMTMYTDFLNASPNEQVSKFSLNRTLQKLHANDVQLSSMYQFGQRIKAYSPDLVYAEGDYVWYKHAATDLNVYLLRSLKENNAFVPTVIRFNGKNVVVPDANWIVCNALTPDNYTIVDSAELYLDKVNSEFEQGHQANMSYHKNGKLRKTDSNILLKNLENIAETRGKFLYPSHSEGIAAGEALSGGFMRAWPNGTLEYDLQYRFDDNSAVLSANSLNLSKLADNAMYFATDGDRTIFDFAGSEQMTYAGKTYKNLSNKKNAFAATLRFPTPFKDTNYTLFASQLCATQGQERNPEWIPIADGTNNFNYQSLTITDAVDQNAFDGRATIDAKAINIGDGALSAANRTAKTGLSISFEGTPVCRNIGDYAFKGSYLTNLALPQCVKHVGLGALDGCDQLQTVTFDVHSKDEPNTYMLPPKLFAECQDSLSIYVNVTGGTKSDGDMSPLYDILTANYNFFGLKTSNNIFYKVGGEVELDSVPIVMAASAPAESPNSGASTMDIKSFLACAKALIDAGGSIKDRETLDGFIVDMKTSMIVGVDPSLVTGSMEQIAKYPIAGIATGAISGLALPSADFSGFGNFTIKYHAFDGATIGNLHLHDTSVLDECSFVDTAIDTLQINSLALIADRAFDRCAITNLSVDATDGIDALNRKLTNCSITNLDLHNVDFIPEYALSGINVKAINIGFAKDAIVEENAFSGTGSLSAVRISGIKQMASAYGCFQNAMDATFYGFQENAFSGCTAPISIVLDDVAARLETSPYYQTFVFEVAPGVFNRLGLPDGSTIKTKARALYYVSNGAITSTAFTAAAVKYSGIVIEDGAIIHARPSECTHYVNITDEISAIGDYAFANCVDLETLHFAYPEKLKQIGDYAFYNCTNLSSIADHIESSETMSAIVKNTLSVDSVGSYAFYNADSLTSLAFTKPMTAPTIGAGAFYNSAVNTLEFKTGDLAAVKNKIGWSESNKDPLEMPSKSQIKVGTTTYDQYLVNNTAPTKRLANINAIVFVDKTPSSVKALYIADSGTANTPIITTDEVFRCSIIGKWK